MRPSSKVIAEFIGVFLVGALVGGLIERDWMDTSLNQFMLRTNDPNTLVQRLTDKYANQYHFTNDEMTRIGPLIQEMAQKTSQIRHQFGTDIINIMDEYHTKISAQLTPDHAAAYLKAWQDRRQQIREMLLLDQPVASEGKK